MDGLNAKYPLIAALSHEDLSHILESQEYRCAVIEQLPLSRHLRHQESELRAEIKQLSELNLTCQPRLNQARQETLASHKDAVNSQKTMVELDSALNSLASRYEPDFLLLRIKHAQQDADRASVRLSDELLKQSSAEDIDKFIAEYRKFRRDYHKRRILAEGNIDWSS